MSLTIKEVKTKSDRKAFVDFQFDLYSRNNFWVPPIKGDEVKALEPNYNPAFEFCKGKFWLAYKNGKCVGRIGGIINDLAIQKTGEKNARFSRFEFIDDNEVSQELIKTAEIWAKDQGMKGIQGPLGFTNLDHQGMLIEGYDQLPSVGSEYHLPYYKEHLEKLGYEKEIDWVEFRLTINEVPEKASRIAEIVRKKNGFIIKNFESREEMTPYSDKIFTLLNDAFKDLFSVVPLNNKMIKYYTNRYMSMLNPKFVKVIETPEGEIVAFIVGLPSLSEALQKAKGKLFPIGWWYITRALKKPKVVDLLLTGVNPDKQGTGVAALLINELQKVLIEHGVKYVETTGIFETNQKAIQNWKNYEHIQHKRKRCWKKNLN